MLLPDLVDVRFSFQLSGSFVSLVVLREISRYGVLRGPAKQALRLEQFFVRNRKSILQRGLKRDAARFMIANSKISHLTPMTGGCNARTIPGTLLTAVAAEFVHSRTKANC